MANAETASEVNALIDQWIADTNYTAGDDFSLSFTIDSYRGFGNYDVESIVTLDTDYYLITQTGSYEGLSSVTNSVKAADKTTDPGTANSENANPVNTYSSSGALYGWISKQADGQRPASTLAGATISVAYDAETAISTIEFILAAGGKNVVNMSGYVLDANDIVINETRDYVLSNVSIIPEPSAFGLLAGLGALALVGTRRRKRA